MTNLVEMTNFADEHDHQDCGHDHDGPCGHHVITPIINQHNTGRNDPCLCGSGKKYKKCCLKMLETASA